MPDHLMGVVIPIPKPYTTDCTALKSVPKEYLEAVGADASSLQLYRIISGAHRNLALRELLIEDGKDIQETFLMAVVDKFPSQISEILFGMKNNTANEHFVSFICGIFVLCSNSSSDSFHPG